MSDHFNNWSSLQAPVVLNTADSPLFVGSCLESAPGNCTFQGGVKFVILFDRQLSSQEHVNIAKWANSIHGIPIFIQSAASSIQPWGIFAGVGAQSLTSCAMPVHDLNNAARACQTHPSSSLDRFPAGVSCISANQIVSFIFSRWFVCQVARFTRKLAISSFVNFCLWDFRCLWFQVNSQWNSYLGQLFQQPCIQLCE